MPLPSTRRVVSCAIIRSPSVSAPPPRHGEKGGGSSSLYPHLSSYLGQNWAYTMLISMAAAYIHVVDGTVPVVMMSCIATTSVHACMHACMQQLYCHVVSNWEYEASIYGMCMFSYTYLELTRESLWLTEATLCVISTQKAFSVLNWLWD